MSTDPRDASGSPPASPSEQQAFFFDAVAPADDVVRVEDVAPVVDLRTPADETDPDALPSPGALLPDTPAEPIVEIRASARRRRTVTAYREGDRTIVLVPARMSKRERERHAAELVERLARRDERGPTGDAELLKRAAQLSKRYLDGAARPASVRWVGNQRSRWGSCTPLDRTIRLSDRMRGMPDYVIDAVLLHELAHLIHADHGPEFRALVERDPDHGRARAYLEGVAWAQQHLPR